MPQDATRLVWIDLEMTGLKPDADRILEVAMVVTDVDLATVAESTAWVVHQSDAMLAGMDSWNTSTHGKSGLVDKVKASLDANRSQEDGADDTARAQGQAS